jgi:hypothetical protein
LTYFEYCLRQLKGLGETRIGTFNQVPRRLSPDDEVPSHTADIGEHVDTGEAIPDTGGLETVLCNSTQQKKCFS